MDDEDSDTPHEQQDLQKVKKKRLHGACDACRKRKIKCDSAIRPQHICSYCEGNNIQCTHDAPRPPGKKETQEAYIRSMEERLSRIEHIVQALHPNSDIQTLLDSTLNEVTPSTETVSTKKFPELKYPTPHLPSTHLKDESIPDPIKQEPEVDLVEEAQDLSHVELVEHMNKLFIEDKRFFGQASTYMFAQYTMNVKVEATGGEPTANPLDSNTLRRPVYWGMRPWEMSHATSEENIFEYPDRNLLHSLVSLYFEKSNIIMPILHRPTFLRSLNSGLHLRDPAFGMTVLLVCAIGSRFISNGDVLLDNDISQLSAGWKYFVQVPIFRKALYVRSTLYDLQCCVLAIVYLMGTSTSHVAWPLLGLGIRLAQEKGIHRRTGQQRHTVEDESAKLVFWCLIVIDRWTSAFLGRPCSMQDEDLDLEYPVECDEEYWEMSDPEKAFRQPPGKPCTMSSFIWLIKLAEMLGFAHRTLYATKKSKILIGLIGDDWEVQAVSELDSSMNKWKDSLPHFLRWNPENPDTTFFCQSIALYTAFYHLQIQVHRPFLMKRSALSRTSLAMCTNAARSTAHVLEAAMVRGVTLFPSSHMSGFAASLVLLLTDWAHHQSESTFDSKTTKDLVGKLFLSLRDGETRWHMAGRFVDLMQILGSLSDQPTTPQLKRRLELNIIEPPVSQGHNQQDYHGSLWEPTTIVGGSVQRQIAAAKLELPAHMQAYPTGNWHINNFLPPQMGSNVQQPFVPVIGQVEHPLYPPIAQNPSPASFMAGSNYQPSFISQARAPHLLDPPMQTHFPAEGPPNFAGLDLSDDLLAMWANAPISFGSHDWDIFLRDAIQPGP